jgi:hypothetical protein
MPRELSNPLTDEDKDWLRSWNRADEIPDNDGSAQVSTELVPGMPPGGETNPANQDALVDPFGGEEPPEDYNDWTNAQLQSELGNRNLPKSGSKAQLVSRLEEDDANQDKGDGS